MFYSLLGCSEEWSETITIPGKSVALQSSLFCCHARAWPERGKRRGLAANVFR